MARLLFIIAVSLSVASSPALSSVARYKGLYALSKELSARIAPVDGPIELDQFMPADGLDDLTGTWSAFGSEHHFQNGTPNAVNMVLLRLAFSGFAQSLGRSCASPQILLNDNFYDTLETVCTWPSAEAKSEAALSAFWLSIMGYDASESEFKVWRDFFRKTYAKKKAAETVEAMTLAIMLNPYFLLEQ
jgi:hypothetical protein